MLKRILIFFSVIVFLGILSVYYPYLVGDKEIIKQEYEKKTCFVNRIIDGDTLVCNNETIRLLGINTPEKGEAFSDEATEFLRQVEGKEVEILRDWEDKGKYHRKLRYIFYENRLINVEIVEQGLAIAFMTERLKYEEKFFNAEKFAQENCLRIWKENC